jgi:hypothetical protein
MLYSSCDLNFDTESHVGYYHRLYIYLYVVNPSICDGSP